MAWTSDMKERLKDVMGGTPEAETISDLPVRPLREVLEKDQVRAELEKRRVKTGGNGKASSQPQPPTKEPAPPHPGQFTPNPNKAAVIERMRQGEDIAALAAEYGMYFRTVSRWADQLGIPRERSGYRGRRDQYRHPNKDKAVEMLRGGVTVEEVMEACTVDRGTVWRWCQREGLPWRTSGGRTSEVLPSTAESLLRLAEMLPLRELRKLDPARRLAALVLAGVDSDKEERDAGQCG